MNPPIWHNLPWSRGSMDNPSDVQVRQNLLMVTLALGPGPHLEHHLLHDCLAKCLQSTHARTHTLFCWQTAAFQRILRVRFRCLFQTPVYTTGKARNAEPSQGLDFIQRILILSISRQNHWLGFPPLSLFTEKQAWMDKRIGSCCLWPSVSRLLPIVRSA